MPGGYTFGVVTEVPMPNGPGGPLPSGNLATALGNVFVEEQTPSQDNGWEGRYSELPFHVAIGLRTPVFNVGELLIMGTNGREVGYPGRKPSKWHVAVEEFDTVEEAVARSEEAVAAFNESLARNRSEPEDKESA